MFDDVPGAITFRPKPGPEDEAWWISRMPEGSTPTGVAAALAKGLPGDRNADIEVSARKELASFTIVGSAGNVEMWMSSTTIELKGMSFTQDGLNIDHTFRGAGLAQRIVGNSVDLARAFGARAVDLSTENVGGYMWVKAGALPIDWTALSLQVEDRLRTLARRRRVDEDLASRI